MQLGVSFPIFEIGTDPGPIKAFLQAADELGFDYLANIDHVLGVDEASHPDYNPIPGMPTHYLLENPFHEMFTLFAFAAAVTEKIKFFSTILLLAQRQTGIVAKQAAQVDILSGGRLILGVGVGHTKIEFQGLGADFQTRGARIEEQVEVLRMLWTQEVVHFKGKFHDLDGVGINPRPIQQPIPIWMGGWKDVVIKRGARLADGLCYPGRPVSELRQMVADAGRDPSAFGVIGALLPVTLNGPDDETIAAIEAQGLDGATHVTVTTEGLGYTPDQHIEALSRFKDSLTV